MQTFLVLLFTLLISSCVLTTEGTAVPHASFKIGVSEQAAKPTVLNNIDRTLINIGFKLEGNDWEVWEPILNGDELEDKRNERRYTLGRFEVFYRPDSLEYIRLNFYEHDERKFSGKGISKYYELRSSFIENEILLLEATDKDVQIGRPVITPEQFNKTQPSQTIVDKAAKWGLFLASLLVYIAVIFLPAWHLLKKASRKTAIGLKWKRIVFSFLSAIFLFPMPIPLSMFGPMLLVPGILLLPISLDLPAHYLQLASGSFVITIFLSSIASFKYVQKYP